MTETSTKRGRGRPPEGQIAAVEEVARLQGELLRPPTGSEAGEALRGRGFASREYLSRAVKRGWLLRHGTPPACSYEVTQEGKDAIEE